MTEAAIYESMKTKLGRLIPDGEIREKAHWAHEIEILKKEKNALILGHNYMEPALYHSVCDIRGDSLELARASAQIQAERLVFCGVAFMAETAKLLNPNKKVLIPSQKAGCSLASSIQPQDVRAMKMAYPGVPVVTYINTYAEIKAESDICCTSGNAAQVVRSLGEGDVIFIPDEYLAQNVAKEVGKTLTIWGEKEPPSHGRGRLIAWKGRCEVHEQFTVEDVHAIREQFPQCSILAHPECSLAVCEESDFSGSTSKMIDFVKSQKGEYALLTECAMADNIIAQCGPDREILRMCQIRCPHMAQITLEMTYRALKEDQFEVTLDPGVAFDAKKSLDRMLALR
jgi:quinolinate synthase